MRISYYGRIPDAAVVVGVVGCLNNQLRFAFKHKGINAVFDKGGISFGGYRPGFAETLPVQKEPCGAERLLQIEQDTSVSPQMQTPCGDSIGILIFMK